MRVFAGACEASKQYKGGNRLIVCPCVCVQQIRAENGRLKQSLLAAEQKFHKAMKKHQLAFEEKCRNFKVNTHAIAACFRLFSCKEK